MAGLRKDRRKGILEETALGRVTPVGARGEIEALLWLDRVAYHAWRAHHHLTAPGGKEAV